MGAMMNIAAASASYHHALSRRPAGIERPAQAADPSSAPATAKNVASRLKPDVRTGALLDASAIQISQADPAAKPAIAAKTELSEAEQATVKELKARDAEVHRHEEAHARAGGAYAGTPSYQFQRGPDGGQYAVGGSMPIDVAPIAGDPQATIRKMQTVKRAASAPAEPSGQDRAISAAADAAIMQARAELGEKRATERDEAADPQTPGAADIARSTQAYAQTAALIAA